MDEIVKYQSTSIIRTMEDAERAARAMANSGFFQDAKQANQAIVKILAGQELGFGPFASMTGVAIIQGKPAVGANLQAAAVKRTGKYNYRVLEMTNESCELEFYEAGKAVGKSRFDMGDASAAGLAAKENWKKWPRNMLFARAISNGVKWYAPDIFNGATVYTPDELDAQVDEDGNAVITAQVETLSPATVSPEQLATSLQGVKTTAAPKPEQAQVKLVQRDPVALQAQAVTLASAKETFSAAWQMAKSGGLGTVENKNAWRITGASTVEEIQAKTSLILAAIEDNQEDTEP